MCPNLQRFFNTTMDNKPKVLLLSWMCPPSLRSTMSTTCRNHQHRRQRQTRTAIRPVMLVAHGWALQSHHIQRTSATHLRGTLQSIHKPIRQSGVNVDVMIQRDLTQSYVAAAVESCYAHTHTDIHIYTAEENLSRLSYLKVVTFEIDRRHRLHEISSAVTR